MGTDRMGARECYREVISELTSRYSYLVCWAAMVVDRGVFSILKR